MQTITEQIVGLKSSHSFTDEEFIRISNLMTEALVVKLASSTETKIEVVDSQYWGRLHKTLRDCDTGVVVSYSTVHQSSTFYRGKIIAIQVNVARSYHDKQYKRITPAKYDRVDQVVTDIAEIFVDMVKSEKQRRKNVADATTSMKSFIGSLGYSTEGVNEKYASLKLPNTEYGHISIEKRYTNGYLVRLDTLTEEQVRKVVEVLKGQ